MKIHKQKEIKQIYPIQSIVTQHLENIILIYTKNIDQLTQQLKAEAN